MNLIYLSHYLYSKEKVQECVLLIQLVCMIIFALVVLGPIDTFLQKYSSLEEIYRYDLSSFCHISAGNATMQKNRVDVTVDNKLYNTLLTLDGVETVFRFSLQQAVYGTTSKEQVEHQHENESNKVANLLVYSDDMAEYVDWGVDEGEFLCYYDETLLPIIVSPSLIDYFPIGSRANFRVGEREAPVSCIVTGVLSQYTSVPTIYNYGSEPNMEVLISYLHDMKNYDFIIACYNEELLSTIRWEPNYLIKLQNKENLDDIIQTLEKTVGIYGTVKSIPELINESFNTLLKEKRWDVLAFVLLSIIALYGFGGYTFLMIRRKQEEIAIFRILGMQQRHVATMVFIAEALLLIIASIVAYLIFPWFSQKVLIEPYTRPGIISFLFCGSLFVCILVVSIRTGFQQSRKATDVALYNGGD